MFGHVLEPNQDFFFLFSFFSQFCDIYTTENINFFVIVWIYPKKTHFSNIFQFYGWKMTEFLGKNLLNLIYKFCWFFFYF